MNYTVKKKNLFISINNQQFIPKSHSSLIKKSFSNFFQIFFSLKN